MLHLYEQKFWIANIFLPLTYLIIMWTLNVGLSSAETVTITGRVTFPDGEIPLFATITIGTIDTDALAKQTTTDNSGNYVFEDIPLGTYNMSAFGGSVSRVGGSIKQNIEITSDTPLPLLIDIILSPEPPQVK